MTSLITPELVLMEHRDRLAAAERARRIRHDQAHVEQKNGAVVRRIVGYRRLDVDYRSGGTRVDATMAATVEIAMRCAYRARTRKPILPSFGAPSLTTPAQGTPEGAALQAQVAAARIVYLEGYLWDQPQAKEVPSSSAMVGAPYIGRP